MKEEINWVTREDTYTPVMIIKGENLKGAIRNRKVPEKAPKKKTSDLSTTLLHTQIK